MTVGAREGGVVGGSVHRGDHRGGQYWRGWLAGEPLRQGVFRAPRTFHEHRVSQHLSKAVGICFANRVFPVTLVDASSISRAYVP